MSRRKTALKRQRGEDDPSSRRSGKRQADSTASPSASLLPSAAAIRETVESIVIAFVLAFLFRTFEAEAFVIPTGSMAPTLMGRHKDLVCPRCGCAYRVGSSEEVDENEVPKGRAFEIAASTCPMCRYTAQLDSDFDFAHYPHCYPPSHSYSGDRLLVDKLAYELKPTATVGRGRVSLSERRVQELYQTASGQTGRDDPHPVRRNLDPPREAAETEFEIARKPPTKLLAMLQRVFDNDYMPNIARFGWPERWTADKDADKSADKGAANWTKGPGADFCNDGRGADQQWLRYQHRVPTADDWDSLKRAPEWQRCCGPDAAPTDADWKALREAGGKVVKDGEGVRPQLITDFTAFDTSWSNKSPWQSESPPTGFNWVADLAVVCTADVQSSTGKLSFELRKGGRRFQCDINVATGRATLSISGDDKRQWRPEAATAVRGSGSHEIRFSNCDNELRLWVDGRVVSVSDHPTAYDDLKNHQPDESDLTPVGIGSAGAKVRISHLQVLRDIYYIATDWNSGGMVDYDYGAGPPPRDLLQYLQSHPQQRFVEFPPPEKRAPVRTSFSCVATTAPTARTAGSG